MGVLHSFSIKIFLTIKRVSNFFYLNVTIYLSITFYSQVEKYKVIINTNH